LVRLTSNLKIYNALKAKDIKILETFEVYMAMEKKDEN